jgi:hypothetical protein
MVNASIVAPCAAGENDLKQGAQQPCATGAAGVEDLDSQSSKGRSRILLCLHTSLMPGARAAALEAAAIRLHCITEHSNPPDLFRGPHSKTRRRDCDSSCHLCMTNTARYIGRMAYGKDTTARRAICV